VVTGAKDVSHETHVEYRDNDQSATKETSVLATWDRSKARM